MAERLLPVSAHRLLPGDVIRCRDDGQIHVNAKDTTQSRTLTAVEVLENDKKACWVALTDTDGQEWRVWDHDVAWFVVPVAGGGDDA